MLSGKKKVQILAAFATLVLFAGVLGCNGFFVNPTLTSIAVGPTATINQGGTVQESAVGTFNDGSTSVLSGVQWSSSATNVANINNSGLVSGASPGTATITGSYQATSGTATITVNLGNVTGLKISPTTGSTAINTTFQFSAEATVQGQSGTQDVSQTATWSTSDPTNVTIDAGTVTVGAGATVGEQVTITATYVSTTTFTATATLTIT